MFHYSLIQQITMSEQFVLTICVCAKIGLFFRWFEMSLITPWSRTTHDEGSWLSLFLQFMVHNISHLNKSEWERKSKVLKAVWHRRTNYTGKTTATRSSVNVSSVTLCCEIRLLSSYIFVLENGMFLWYSTMDYLYSFVCVSHFNLMLFFKYMLDSEAPTPSFSLLSSSVVPCLPSRTFRIWYFEVLEQMGSFSNT